MTNKLSRAQIEDAVLIDSDVDMLDDEIDETSYRTTFQRKEIRTNRKRDDGELVGKGNVRKHRKF